MSPKSDLTLLSACTFYRLLTTFILAFLSAHHIPKQKADQLEPAIMSATLSSVNQSNAAEDNAKLEKQIDALNSDWTNLPKTHPLHHFGIALGGAEGILASAGHNEMYGIELVAGTEESVSLYTIHNNRPLRSP